MPKKKLFKKFVKFFALAMGFASYLAVTITLLTAWFSPNHTAEIGLTQLDLIIKEPFVVSALLPLMTYGTYLIVADIRKKSKVKNYGRIAHSPRGQDH